MSPQCGLVRAMEALWCADAPDTGLSFQAICRYTIVTYVEPKTLENITRHWCETTSCEKQETPACASTLLLAVRK